eukprot:TRINITY_DN2525_c0_g3_i1.p1 TRINITY_DN2525_c0_g3~~TRINITY_DN2525_c0_g3_i1.p1  ORF type:complete len:1043 (-),score=227.01 TRINITY_DN2525_c0_g3_i1:83-3211(-)
MSTLNGNGNGTTRLKQNLEPALALLDKQQKFLTEILDLLRNQVRKNAEASIESVALAHKLYTFGTELNATETGVVGTTFSKFGETLQNFEFLRCKHGDFCAREVIQTLRDSSNCNKEVVRDYKDSVAYLSEKNVEEKEVEDYLGYKAQMISQDMNATVLGQLILYFKGYQVYFEKGLQWANKVITELTELDSQSFVKTSKAEKVKFDNKRPPMKLLSALARRADSDRSFTSSSSATTLAKFEYEKEDNPLENKRSTDLTSAVECFSSQEELAPLAPLSPESPVVARRPMKPQRPPPPPPVPPTSNGSPSKTIVKGSPKMTFKLDLPSAHVVGLALSPRGSTEEGKVQISASDFDHAPSVATSQGRARTYSDANVSSVRRRTMTESSSAIPYKKRDSTEMDQGKVLETKEEISPRKEKAKFLARLASMPAMQKFSPGDPKKNRNSINASTSICDSPKIGETKTKSPPVSPRGSKISLPVTTEHSESKKKKKSSWQILPRRKKGSGIGQNEIVHTTLEESVSTPKADRAAGSMTERELKQSNDGRDSKPGSQKRQFAISASNSKAVAFHIPVDDEDDSDLEDTSEIKYAFDSEGNNPRVRAATVDMLIDHLVCSPYIDQCFVTSFLYTFHSFTTPDYLCDGLISHHKNGNEDTRERVLLFFKLWIERLWWDWKNTDIRLRLLSCFDYDPSVAAGLNASLQFIQLAEAKETVYLQALKEPEPNEIELDILSADINELASEISKIDIALYSTLKPTEFLQQNWQSSRKETAAPNVLSFIKYSNQITNWVITAIVKKVQTKQRVQVLQKMIDLLQRLLQLSDFNAVMAILHGLESTPIKRLKKTWAEVDRAHLAHYKQVEDMMTFEQNYKHYRLLIRNLAPGMVPYLGVFLTDLIFVEEGMDDTVEGLINFQKKYRLAEIISSIMAPRKPSLLDEIPSSKYRQWLIHLPVIDYSEALGLSAKIEPRDTSEAIEKLLMEEEDLRKQIKQLQIKNSLLEESFKNVESRPVSHNRDSLRLSGKGMSMRAPVFAFIPNLLPFDDPYQEITK